jgi:hypothetical protein
MTITDKADFMSYIIDKRGYSSYLEIGIFRAETFSKMSRNPNLQVKIGIDPDKNTCATFHMTSDDFFKTYSNVLKFDLIFIDGMHLCEYVYNDIQNSLKCLNKNGMIVCHDMLPESEAMQTRDLGWYNGMSTPWNGDCWKAFAYYMRRSPYHCFTLDFDCGLGVIDTSKNFIMEEQNTNCVKLMEEMTWDDFKNNKMFWMNVKSKDYVFEI